MVRPVFTALGNGGGIDPTDCRFGVFSSQDTRESVYDDDFKAPASKTNVARDQKERNLLLMVFVNEI
jgi:hypothetical protein